MTGKVFIKGQIGDEVELIDVIRQVKAFDESVDTLLFDISTVGGSLNVGDDIYNYMIGLKSDYNVNTITDKAYSVGAKIFAAGTERTVIEGDDRIMIHYAWADKISGKAEKFEAVAEYLREQEVEFAKFYNEILDIDEDTVHALLDNDTFINSSDALAFGLATEIKEPELKAVAKLNFNLNKSNMSTKKKLGLFARFEKWLDETGGEVVALTLQDSDSNEIVFEDLAEGDEPKVGDSAKMGDVSIPDGSYIMPSLDNATVTFVDGKVSEIVPEEKEAEADPDSADGDSAIVAKEADADTKDKEEVKAETINEVSVWTVEVTNSSFAVGDIVKYAYDDSEHPVMAGEFKLNDGRTIVTNASGEIVAISEGSILDDAPVEASEEEKDEEVFAVMAKVSERFEAAIEAKYEKKFEDLNKELKDFKAKFKSEEIDTSEEFDAGAGSKKKSGNYLAGVMRGGKE